MNKIKRSINLSPIFSALSADLIWFIPIDTLYLTLVKGLTVSQITALTMISLTVCILLRKWLIRLTQKMGNVTSTRIGALLLFISCLLLTFGTSFLTILLYRIIFEIAFVLKDMSLVVLKNNLNVMHQSSHYHTIRNKANILYSIFTMIAALLAGYLFNKNHFFPLYLSSVFCFIAFILSLFLYEDNKNITEKEKTHHQNIKITYVMGLVLLSSTLFYACIRMGQTNTKLLMQYDFQNLLSIELVTHAITMIVLLSRICRILGNILFNYLYKKIKNHISIVFTFLLFLAFLFPVMGHFIPMSFIGKAIFMSIGFCLILAIRDSFQIYIEDTVLNLTKKEDQAQMMMNVAITKQTGHLILSILCTLILYQYELIIVECLLLGIATIELLINFKMYRELNKL